MTFPDWAMAVGLPAAMPVLGYASYNQWSSRPGATGRMVAGCAVFAVIVSGTMLAAHLAD